MPDALVLNERDAWLEARRSGIGASESSAILGLSYMKSPYALWAEKLGLVANSPDSEAALWGRKLEAVIADHYAETAGLKVTNPGAFTIQRHPRRSFMMATLDRVIEPANGRGPGVLEVKTAGAKRIPDWADGVPLYYQVQVQHQLAVTGYEYGVVAVLLAGQEFRAIEIERNPDFIDVLEDECEKFWGLVASRTPPPVDDGMSTERVLKEVYAREQAGRTVRLPVEANEWAKRLVALRNLQARTRNDLRAVENALRAAIGEAALGELSDGSGTVVMTTVHKDGYTVAPTDYRQLRFKPATGTSVATNRNQEEPDGTAVD